MTTCKKGHLDKWAASKQIIEKVFTVFYNEQIIISESQAGARKGDQYICIGKKDQIRWILPRNYSGNIDILRQWRPGRITTRLAWVLFLFLYKHKFLPFFPNERKIGIIRSKSNNNNSSSSLVRTNRPVYIYIGSSGLTQKAVILLHEMINSQQCTSVMKIPIGIDAPKAIQKEARIISNLSKSHSRFAPKLLAFDKQKGTSIQEFIAGNPSKNALTPQHIKWLIGLSRNIQIGPKDFFISWRVQFMNALKIRPLAPLVENALISAMNTPTRFESVWLHGDFAPWNIKYCKGNLIAIDWEMGFENGLPLIDLLHYYWIQKYLLNIRGSFRSFLDNPLVIDYCDAFDLTDDSRRHLSNIFFAFYWQKNISETNYDHAQSLLITYMDLNNL